MLIWITVETQFVCRQIIETKPAETQGTTARIGDGRISSSFRFFRPRLWRRLQRRVCCLKGSEKQPPFSPWNCAFPVSWAR